MKNISILLVIATFLAACSSSPTLEQSAEFGKSAASVAKTYATAQTAEVDLIKTASVEAGACRYVGDAHLVFPARPIAKPSSKIKDQVLFLKAVEEYATALSEAVDPAGVKKLEAAADGFVVSASDFAGKAAASRGGVAPPAAGPSIKVATAIGTGLFERDLHNRIRKVAKETDNIIYAGSIKLQGDIKKNKQTLNRWYGTWLENKKCSLNEIRARPTTGAELYHEYVEANRTAEEFQTRIKVLDEAEGILGQLIETHGALFSDDVDLNASLAQFRTLIGKIDLLKQGIEAS